MKTLLFITSVFLLSCAGESAAPALPTAADTPLIVKAPSDSMFKIKSSSKNRKTANKKPKSGSSYAISKPAATVKKKRATSSYSDYSPSYSGLCGAPTKKGGSCRRRVSGGGRCWQH